MRLAMICPLLAPQGGDAGVGSHPFSVIAASRKLGFGPTKQMKDALAD
jgi:hypothetical protein